MTPIVYEYEALADGDAGKARSDIGGGSFPGR